MRRTALALAVASLGLTACTTDPAFWEAVAVGLDQAAADIEWENRNCYWAPPPGIPYGAAQKYCPGDWNYAPPGPVVVSCAPRDRDCNGVNDRRDRRERRRDRGD